MPERFRYLRASGVKKHWETIPKIVDHLQAAEKKISKKFWRQALNALNTGHGRKFHIAKSTIDDGTFFS